MNNGISKKHIITASILVVTIGLILLIAGTISRFKNNQIQNCTMTTTGTVTSVYKYHRRGKVNLSIKYTFSVNTQQYSGAVTLTNIDIKEGDTCNVYFNPNNASENYIGDAPYKRKIQDQVIQILGITFIILGTLSGLGALKYVNNY